MSGGDRFRVGTGSHISHIITHITVYDEFYIAVAGAQYSCEVSLLFTKL
jgi:uncharacterized membrane protein